MNVSHLMRGISCAVSRRVRTAGALLLSLGILAGTAVNANAEGFALSEWSARGMALGGGVASGMVARADDASAVAYNPAGITQIPGTSFMFGMSAVALNLEFERSDTGTNNRNAKQVWPIPHMYATHQLSDNLWFGIGMNTRYGLGSQFKNGWSKPGLADMYSGTPTGTLKSITLLSSSINPSIAYKVNDIISLAAGIDYTWGYLSLNQRYMAYHPDLGSLSADARIHSENGYAFGWNLAAHAKLNDEWSAGLTYRAHEDLRFKGSLRARYADLYSGIAFAGKGLIASSGRAKLRTPDVFTAGIKYQPMQNLSFEFDTAYTVWSRYRNLSIDFSNPLTAKFNEQKNWHDTWAFTVGAEYSPLDWLTLRAGFTYETSPLKNVAPSHYDYLVPTNGRNYYSLGVGFKYDKWTLDLAYMYIRVRDMNYPGSIDTLGLRKTFSGSQHKGYANNFAMSIGYRF